MVIKQVVNQLGYSLLILLGIGYLTGCGGFEVGGKVGLYRVDEHAESSRMVRKPLPLKCYFTDCSQLVNANEEAHGS